MAMFSLEYDPSSVPVEASLPVSSPAAADLEALLYGWLSELLWLHDAEGFVPASVSAASVSVEAGADGAAHGAPLGGWFVQTGPQLKAVTMHGLRVGPRGDGYEATVYLDV